MGNSLHSTSERTGIHTRRTRVFRARLRNGDGADRNYIPTPMAGLEAQRHTGRRRALARSAEARAWLTKNSYVPKEVPT
jgi:hypothetical protein